jgi:prolyl oligopeptidase
MSTNPPRTEKCETVEPLNGEEIPDPYRWLEGDDEAVGEWVAAQNEYADPRLWGTIRDELRPRFEELAETVTYFPIVPTSGGYFQRVSFPDDDLLVLTGRDDPTDERRVLTDPNEWSDDGFYYGRTGTLDESDQLDKSIGYHRLRPRRVEDDRELPVELDDQTWARLHTDADGDHLVVNLVRDWARSDVYRVRDGELESLVVDEDAIFEPNVRDDRIFFRTSADAPNYRIVATSLETSGEFATADLESVVPERDAILRDFAFAGDRIVAHYERDAISKLSVFTLDGERVEDVSLPGVGSVDGLRGSNEGGECFFRFQSFDQPPTVYRYAVGGGLAELDRPEVRIDLEVE